MTIAGERAGVGRDEDTPVVTRVSIPGGGVLAFERDRATSALLGVSGGGRQYLTGDPATRTLTWHGICSVREEPAGDGLRRHVRAAGSGQAWCEEFRWADGRLVEVDGVEVRRDGAGRVIACLPGGADPAPPGHRWFYGHGEQGLVHVEGPDGVRSIALDGDGRPVSVHQDGLARPTPHDAHGRRRAPGRPLRDHVDEAGRCWAGVGPHGSVRHVYIWDGTRCLARIDGPVGGRLGAVFSLDPSGTPVRVIEPDRVRRVPRDAYAEGLLGHPGVPGLFGGQVHAGLVHLPMRRLDPRTGTFCEPDPLDGGDADPRRDGRYEGPLPVEPDPPSRYQACRGDPVGRFDPSGGVSAGLVISDLTWSLQNNILTFFGLDWWFNLFMSAIMWPGDTFEYDFFDSTGLTASERHGGFGIRRDGFLPGMIAALNDGEPRAFTTQHLLWAPDSEFAALETGEVVDCGRAEPTHYGSVLSLTPAGGARHLVQSMDLQSRPWATSYSPLDDTTLAAWTRHGGRGEPVAPGTRTPWFPEGGLHLDRPLVDVRGDRGCRVDELVPDAVALGDLEARSFLSAPSITGLAAGSSVLVGDGSTLTIATVLGVAPDGTRQRVQLLQDLGPLAATGLRLTPLAALPAGTETLGAGTVADSLDVHGTAETYAAGDVLRLAGGGGGAVARVARLEARLPLDRPLPAGLAGPISVTLGAVGAGAVPVTATGSMLDFGTAARPAVGVVGLVAGGGTEVAVRVTGHGGTNSVALDVALPGAARRSFSVVNPGPTIGTRAAAAEAAAELTYVPQVAGQAPDGGAGRVVVRVDAGGEAHARLVPGPPVHDVVVLDRTPAGGGPWTTERFPTAGSPTAGVSRRDVTALVLPDPGRFESAAAVFLSRVAGDPPAAAATLVSGDVVAGVLDGATLPAGGTLQPGQPVLAGGTAAAVADLRVTPTFDRDLELGGGELRLVGLEGVGPAYLATVDGGGEVLVEPRVDVGGTPEAAPFPRFEAGDLARVADRGGANGSWHRVRAAAGGRLELEGAPPRAPGDVEVQAVGTTDPGHGGAFLGIRGERGAAGPSPTATFSVWDTGDLPDATVVGVVDGDVTHPAVVATAPTLVRVQLSHAFDAAGADVVELTTLADRWVASLSRDGDALILDGAVGDLETAAGESIVAVGQRVEATLATGATIGPGTFRVPEGERTEVTRHQALVDHELQHTHQYAQFGPLWFCLFPMVAMELPGILETDTELPQWSAFVGATLAAGTGSLWQVSVADAGGISFGEGDELQLVQGSTRATAEVTKVEGSTLTVKHTAGVMPSSSGRVALRRKQGDSLFDDFFTGLDLLTHGGLVNALAGTTWGGIFWVIGKLAYGLGRAIGGTGDLYPATVEADGAQVRLTNAEHVSHFRREGRVVVRRGDDTVVRSMTRTGAVLTLGEPVALTGGVQLAPYDTHDPDSAFDWKDYYPAAVDPANHFRVTIGAVGDDTLSLSPEDRVTVRYRDAHLNTDVVAVTGDTVELSDPVAVREGELSARIARIGASDPLGNLDSTLMVEMGMDWMKWVFDPYGQIERTVDTGEEWVGWLLRVMRWLLGSQSFSLPPLGYTWWWRLFREADAHTMWMEQQASQESGDLYSPLGRLTGQVEHTAWASARMVVGDVGRYRYWPLAGGARGVAATGLDATTPPDDPPVGYPLDLRTMPHRTAPGAGGSPPNGTVQVGPEADPGRSVAEAFTVRDPDPGAVPGADPLGFETSVLGQVPDSPRTEKMQSTYVAFTRPGAHRVTTDGIANGDLAQQAHAVGQLDVFHGGQRLFYDVEVTDVTVAVGGREVPDDTTGPGDPVTLVPFQRAAATVSPDTARTYRLAVPDPEGPVRADGTTLLARAVTGADPVPVEVSRWYEVGDDGEYGPGGLSFRGMHLSRDLHVPVRRFSVEVVDTLPLRATAAPSADAETSLAAGATGFLLVPAPVVRPPEVVSMGGAPPPPLDPPQISRADAPDAAAFLGRTGAAYAVSFPGGAPTGPVVLRVSVGEASATVELTCTFDLT